MELLASSPEVLANVLLLAGLLIVPRLLQRFRIPGAVTCWVIGAVVAGFGLVAGDATVELLATFGIVALFLVAGLDVDLGELRIHARMLIQHLVLRIFLVAGGTVIAGEIWDLPVRAAALVSLAVMTPSAGFILDSLTSLGLYRDEQHWVRAKVVATELLALAMLLVATQPTGARLGISVGAVALMIAVVPFVLRLLAALILPVAPKSEFALLVIVAVACALITKELGVYYLVGAFIVGVVARRFRERLPAMSSESLVHALEAFGTIFIPFYFFRAGTKLRPEDITWLAAGTGLALYVVGGGIRVAAAIVHHRFALREDWRSAARKAVPMLPTLVFTLVLTEIARATWTLPPSLTGGLVLYALLTTITPAILMPRLPVAEYENPVVGPPSPV
jgi:Kef-type K+ transport system membrane component KefB